METIDRYRGSLMGLAVGDALGAPVEFRNPLTMEKVTGMQSGGTFGLPAGKWTDDMSLALCLAHSLIEKKGFDAYDQMTKYSKWYYDGYMSSIGKAFDIGGSTRMAIEKFAQTHDPYAGSSNPNCAGNGSIMRLAPIPLIYKHSLREASNYSGESSKTTHPTIEAVDACRYFGVLIAQAARGASKEEILSFPSFLTDLSPAIVKVAQGSYKEKEPPEIKGTGYVVESLEAALWAFYKNDNFQDAVLAAVNLGNDTDTTAAVCGQLAGAYYGIDGIPKKWVYTITMDDHILKVADDLYELAEEMNV